MIAKLPIVGKILNPATGVALRARTALALAIFYAKAIIALLFKLSALPTGGNYGKKS